MFFAYMIMVLLALANVVDCLADRNGDFLVFGELDGLDLFLLAVLDILVLMV